MRFKSFIVEMSKEDQLIDHLYNIGHDRSYPVLINTGFIEASDPDVSKNVIGYGTHHRIWVSPLNTSHEDHTRERQLDAIDNIHRKLNDHRIKYEFGHDEENYPTFYIPKNQSDHITEAASRDVEAISNILTKHGYGGSWANNEWDLSKPSITLIPASHYDSFNVPTYLNPSGAIGATTHHKIYVHNELMPNSNNRRGEPDYEERNATHINDISKVLHTHGVNHEVSRNEYNIRTIYIPKDQVITETHINRVIKIVTNHTFRGRNPLRHFVGAFHVDRRILHHAGDLTVNHALDGELEDTVGAGTHHRISFMPDDEFPHDSVAKPAHRDALINTIRAQLHKEKISHEYSHDEANYPTIYIPANKEELNESHLSDPNDDHLYNKIIKLHKQWQKKEFTFTYPSVSASHGGALVHADDINDKNLVGFGTHHRIWFGKPIGDPDWQTKYITSLRKHLVLNGNIKHEFSMDEDNYPTIYIPKNQ